ncbi:hypothetical protein [Roseixanthobacter liquoris]|uniref:hypothetical protein n=1 Tax=Roseixanthobacter liquoris TaxID=3119921 RepID=UPI00372C3CDA
MHEITALDVAEILKSVWEAKPEVARKLHPAIRRVFDCARVVLKAKHNIQMLENPANWVDLKAQGFSRPKELSRGRHPSLPYPRMKPFMQGFAGARCSSSAGSGIFNPDERENGHRIEGGVAGIRPGRRRLADPATQNVGRLPEVGIQLG